MMAKNNVQPYEGGKSKHLNYGKRKTTSQLLPEVSLHLPLLCERHLSLPNSMCTTPELRVESTTLQTPLYCSHQPFFCLALCSCLSPIYFPSGISLPGHPLFSSKTGEKVGKAKHGEESSTTTIVI